MKLIYFILLILSTHARADTAVGVSEFALLHPRFPTSRNEIIFRNVDTVFVSVLLGTFGDSPKNLEKLLTMPKRNFVIELVLTNEAGRTKGRLQQGEIAPKLTRWEYLRTWEQGSRPIERAVKRRLEKWSAVAARYPAVEWIMSIGLESTDTKKSATARAKFVRRYWKHEIAWNPVPSSSHRIGADYIELHGDRPAGARGKWCIANNDGTEITFRNPSGQGWAHRGSGVLEAGTYATRASRVCRRVLLWYADLSNGIRATARWTPPRQRSPSVSLEVANRMNQILIENN